MQSVISGLRSWLHSTPPVNRDGRPWNDEQSSLRRPLPCTVPGLEKDSSSRPPGPTQMSPSIPGEGPVMSTLPPPSWRMTHSSMSSPKLGLMQLPVGGIGVNTHPVAGSQVSVVQVLLSLQVMGVNTHPVAGLQVSVVHALLSLQVMGVKTHPVAGLQVSVVHALLSLQVIGVLEQTPVAWSHTSVVHALLSSQTGQRKMNPAPVTPDTPPREHVASLWVASYPRTCSSRLTVPRGRLSSWASAETWNVTVHPVASFCARRSGVGTLFTRSFTKVNTIWLVADPPAGTFEMTKSWLRPESTQVVPAEMWVSPS